MLSWLQLLRLPTVFPAIAHILCGFLIAAAVGSPGHTEWFVLPGLILASAGLYLGGMVLNDVFDARLDAQERPERPIPSGRIPVRRAAAVGILLLAVGLVAAVTVWLFMGQRGHSPQIAAGIALAVLAYNAVLKKTWAGPGGMAVCRFLNLSLGASAGISESGEVLAWQQPVIGPATGLAVYIVGVTWFARNEAGESTSFGLDAGLAVAAIGIAVSAASALFVQQNGITAMAGLVQYGVILMATIVRGVSAIRDGRPPVLQRTVGKMLLWIIVLDAVTVFTVTGSVMQEAVLLLLLVPAILLRKRIPMS